MSFEQVADRAVHRTHAPRVWTALAAVLLVFCSKRTPVEEAGVPSAPAEEQCVDRWLAQHHLDPFGAPEGSVYAGGTPLVDESTGEATPRLAHVYAKYPVARDECAPDAGARAR